MASYTAIKPRPYIVPMAVAQVELVKALPEDLKVFDRVHSNGNPIYKIRKGMIFWFQSSITGQIEPTPRTLIGDEDSRLIKQWLDAGMIWIAKNEFN